MNRSETRKLKRAVELQMKAEEDCHKAPRRESGDERADQQRSNQRAGEGVNRHRAGDGGRGALLKHQFGRLVVAVTIIAPPPALAGVIVI